MVCHRSLINDGESITSHRLMNNNTYPGRYLSHPITSVYVALFLLSLCVSFYFLLEKAFVYSFVFPKKTPNEPLTRARFTHVPNHDENSFIRDFKESRGLPSNFYPTINNALPALSHSLSLSLCNNFPFFF